ncbi:2-oxoglutarate/malate transporter [Nocardia sp. NPDC047648]|uniref:2-oxoglutarate/malate transporter n=1 Tax=Nocardia sp. NPDC047648 TaxID=3155625 RepID=UPI0033FB0A95
MSVITAAGIAGLGFVLTAIVVNVGYVRARLPFPAAAEGLDAVTDAFATVGARLRRPSVLAPVGWLCLTVFAAGVLSVLWRGGSGVSAWALVGFAGVLMQNVAFMCVEALRFGLAAAAHDRASTAGLWGFSNVLFGFNQVFLAMAVLGFTIAGAGVGFIPTWHIGLGYVSAALLFISAAASPYNAEGTSRLAPIGLIGWLGWAGWIIAYSIALIRL